MSLYIRSDWTNVGYRGTKCMVTNELIPTVACINPRFPRRAATSAAIPDDGDHLSTDAALVMASRAFVDKMVKPAVYWAGLTYPWAW